MRRVQQIQIAKVSDLDPALAGFALGHVERVFDRAKPGRHHHIHARDQGFDGFWHRRQGGVGGHVHLEMGPARQAQALHGLDHTRVEQRVGEHEQTLARAHRKHLEKIVHGLKVLARGRDFVGQGRRRAHK